MGLRLIAGIPTIARITAMTGELFATYMIYRGFGYHNVRSAHTATFHNHSSVTLAPPTPTPPPSYAPRRPTPRPSPPRSTATLYRPPVCAFCV